MTSENPDITLAILCQEALHWVREESPVDTVHVQQQKMDSSEMALLKTQMAAMTEAMRAMQMAVKSLAAPQPPHDNIPGKTLLVPKDGAHGTALPEGTKRKLEAFTARCQTMEAELTAAHWNLRGQCPETLMEVDRKAVMAAIHTGSQVLTVC